MEDLLYYANMLYESYENMIGYIERILNENDKNNLELSAKIYKLLNSMVCNLYESNPTSGILLNFYLANTNRGTITAEMMYNAFEQYINSVAAAQVIMINALRDIILGITLDGKKTSGKDLSYQDYLIWLDTATTARDQFLAGKIPEQEAIARIVK